MRLNDIAKDMSMDKKDGGSVPFQSEASSISAFIEFGKRYEEQQKAEKEKPRIVAGKSIKGSVLVAKGKCFKGGGSKPL